MVLQVAPDTGPVHATGNAERGQPFRRANTGAMQNLRRTDRAGAENDLAFGARLEHLAVACEQNTRGAAVLDNEAIDQHILFKTQIGALQGGLEETAGRRPAAPAFLVDVEIADALIVAGVEIRDSANPHLLGGIADGIEDSP